MAENPLFKKLTKSFMDHPWLWGLSLAILVRLYLGIAFDLSPRCESGWKSPSIGNQGACSHHGGVFYPSAYATILSIVIAAIPHLLRWHRENKETDAIIERSREAVRAHSESELARQTLLDECKSARISGEDENFTYAPDNVSPCPIHGRMVLSKDATRWTCTEYPSCQYYWIK